MAHHMGKEVEAQEPWVETGVCVQFDGGRTEKEERGYGKVAAKGKDL